MRTREAFPYEVPVLITALCVVLILLTSLILPSTDMPSSTAGRSTDPLYWVLSDDYPASAVRAGVQGRTKIRIAFDAEGLPSACEVIESSGSDALDGAACDAVRRRAMISPADPSDTDTRYSERGVVWRLPE